MNRANRRFAALASQMSKCLDATPDPCARPKGKLDLGPWEQIFYGEFDGRRRKRVLVKIIGE